MNLQIRLPWLVRASAAACILANSPLHAEGFEQHDAHEHGSVVINVAVDSGRLSLELRAPAVNVVGFEHSPRTAQENAAAANALAMLESASGFLGVSPDARCRLAASQVSPPRWDEDDHEHGSPAADDDHSEHEHAEYSARLSYVCEAPQKLEWVELRVLGKLRNVHEARVSVISPGGQHSQRVRSSNERVSLRGDRR